MLCGLQPRVCRRPRFPGLGSQRTWILCLLSIRRRRIQLPIAMLAYHFLLMKMVKWTFAMLPGLHGFPSDILAIYNSASGTYSSSNPAVKVPCPLWSSTCFGNFLLVQLYCPLICSMHASMSGCVWSIPVSRMAILTGVFGGSTIYFSYTSL